MKFTRHVCILLALLLVGCSESGPGNDAAATNAKTDAAPPSAAAATPSVASATPSVASATPSVASATPSVASATPSVASATPSVASATGTVESIDAAAGKITLAHGPVESLGWPAMTMAFKVTPEQIAAVQVGQRVNFQFESRGMDATITQIEPAR